MISNHPISIIIFILVVSVYSLCMILFFMKNSWFSLIFMLMMMGGLMVLFMYMASMSSNEYFSFNKEWGFIMLLLFLILPEISSMKSMSEYLKLNLFNYNSLMMYLFFLIYLFLVLVLIVEMLVFVKSSLRSMSI